MEVKLTSENLNELVSKAIFDSMTPEVREALLMNAVRSLMVKPSGGSYNSKTPIEDAFINAAYRVAQQLVRERLETDAAFIAQVDGLFRAVMHKIFEGEMREKVIDGMTQAFVTSMRSF